MQSAAELIRDYIERVWNQCDLQALDVLAAPDFTYHLGGQPPRDRATTGQFLQATHAAFPDWRVEILQLVAEDDFAALRWRGVVTHLGPFHGIPATGRRIAVSGINMYRLAGGQVAQEWEQMDSLGMIDQLGLLPR